MTWSKRPVTAQEPTAPVTAAQVPTSLEVTSAATVSCEVTQGPSAGVRFSLAGKACVIGSDPGCDVRLDDPTVSRRHAEARFFHGALQLVDLGSRNGLVYLGQRVDQLVLPWDAEVKLGRSSLRFSRPKELGRSAQALLAGLVVGKSQVMQELFFSIERLAPREASVVFEGPTGAGKEICAQALHALSNRATGPLMVFDCSATTPELFEAELFGVEAGAFTGAEKSRSGLAESVRGGTLLLDNIDGLALELQPKLLRLLDSREYRRVGGNVTRQADFRAVATAQRELLGRCSDGKFRADLYFRLAGAVLTVPPLAEHREDLPLLIEHFAGQAQLTLTEQQRATLLGREYPGNVRELKNGVSQLATGGVENEPLDPRRLGYHAAREVALQSFEARYVRELLSSCDGNVSLAAKTSGLSRSQLYRIIRRHPSVMKMVRNE